MCRAAELIGTARPLAVRASDRGPARCAEVAGDASGGLDHGGAELLVAAAADDAFAWADDTDCADRLGAAVEDRRGDPAFAEHRLLLLNGVPSLPNCVEIAAERRGRHERLAGQLR